MNTTRLPDSASSYAPWRASSYSNGAGGECVECSLGEASVLIRDSKDTTGPAIAVDSQAWRSFLSGVALGSYAHSL
ncbi:DUF397 domain-containing protein [Streptomyces sp. SID14478]|uniref:DUF397 domain-containing protein n=1 Tax=Streptomyces sp. SID14478 TaxID=2706073 RepID=UPI0013D99A31|nr:DUF397 domain-containing protein [Streptomyces sp. SID14478]NEB74371.1 DUF397 domain-containing protein [Streptomyces sp. SID14478]